MIANPRLAFLSLRSTHPRLMVTAALLKEAADAIKGDAVGERVRRKVVEYAQEQADSPKFPRRDKDPSDPSPWDFLNETRDVLRRFQSLAMAWMLDGNDVRYPQRIKKELAVVCGFYDWNPGHFLDTAEMTHAVAIAYDWFYDHLDPRERQMCIQAVLEKGLRPGYAQLTGTPKPAWPTQSTNWNIVCNAGLMIGALAIGKDTNDPLPDTVFQRCLESVPTGFHGYSPDGGWDEGPGYWAYATEYAAYLLSALDTAVGHKYGLADLPGFDQSGYFRMHCEGAAVSDRQHRKFFNFSDCDEERRGSWCMRWLAHQFKQPQFNWMAHKDGQTRAMDLFWYRRSTPDAGANLPLNKVFRGRANVAMLRGAWGAKSASGFQPWVVQATDDELFLGIRAGHNSRENSHGHLDLGSFVLDAQQVRWATDPQPVDGDYYLPGYFDVDQGRRFRYYRTSTAGHNTLVVNGFNQALGVETEIVGFREDPSEGLVVVVVDLTAAYPDCLRVRRGFALMAGRHVAIVDEFTPKNSMTVAWQMHTKAAALVQGRRVVLEQDRLRFFVQMIDPQPAVLTVQSAPVSQPGEAPNDPKMRKLVATLTNVATPTRIAVYLSPDEPPAQPLLHTVVKSPLWYWIDWAGKG